MANKIEYALNLNVSDFEKGIATATSAASGLSNALNAIGISLSAGAISAAVKNMGDFAERILNTADALNVSTDFLQDFSLNAELSGISAEHAEKALTKLAQIVGDAREGSKEAAEKFKIYGINISDAGGKALSVESILRSVANKLKETDDGATRAAIAVEFFGKEGAKLLPILQDGSAGFDKMRDSIKLTREELAEMDKAADSIVESAKRLQVWGGTAFNFWVGGARDAVQKLYEMKYHVGGLDAAIQRSISDSKRKAQSSGKEFSVPEFIGTRMTGRAAAEIQAEHEKNMAAEEAFYNKMLSDEEQLQNLKTDRHLREIDAARFNKDSVEYAKARNEFEKLNVQIQEKQLDIEKKKADLKKQQAAAQKQFQEAIQNEVDAKRDSLAMTELELQDAQVSRRRNPRLWQAQRDLWMAQNLEDQAKEQFRRGDFDAATQTQDRALAIKRGIEFLKSNEADPFKEFSKASEESASRLEDIFNTLTDGSAKFQALGAP